MIGFVRICGLLEYVEYVELDMVNMHVELELDIYGEFRIGYVEGEIRIGYVELDMLEFVVNMLEFLVNMLELMEFG